jgi:probable rRNA maturation factor
LSNRLAVTVQLATSRAGVPHARSLAGWANAAFAAGGRGRRQSTELTIRIVGAAESRALNRTWRGRDKPTNVLSFGTGHSHSSHLRSSPERTNGWNGKVRYLGDLAICAPVVAREAREQGKPARDHWAHMVVHGVLHLMGYDHERAREAAVMEKREVNILGQLGISNPYA